MQKRIGGGGLKTEPEKIDEEFSTVGACVKCNWFKKSNMGFPEKIEKKLYECPECGAGVRNMTGKFVRQVRQIGTGRKNNIIKRFIKDEKEINAAQKHELTQDGLIHSYTVWCKEVKIWGQKHGLTLSQAINIIDDVSSIKELYWVGTDDYLFIYKCTKDDNS